MSCILHSGKVEKGAPCSCTSSMPRNAALLPPHPRLPGAERCVGAQTEASSYSYALHRGWRQTPPPQPAASSLPLGQFAAGTRSIGMATPGAALPPRPSISPVQDQPGWGGILSPCSLSGAQPVPRGWTTNTHEVMEKARVQIPVLLRCLIKAPSLPPPVLLFGFYAHHTGSTAPRY